MKTLKRLLTTACCVVGFAWHTAVGAPVLGPVTDTVNEWSGTITWMVADDDSFTAFSPTSFPFLPDSTPPSTSPPELYLNLSTTASANVLDVSDLVESGDPPTTGFVSSGASAMTSGVYVESATPVLWQLSIDTVARESTFSFVVIPEPSAWMFLLLLTCGMGIRSRLQAYWNPA